MMPPASIAPAAREWLPFGVGAGRSLRGWLAFFLVSLAAYFPALQGVFIWDDDAHVTRPDLQSLHGLRRIWFDLGATQQYYPVLHSAFWLEHRLWGNAALGYHLCNVGLHATAAWLFALVLRRLWGAGARTDPTPWLAGLIFALHPMAVESVAWISEQKNTLSAVFYLLAALAFMTWRGEQGGPAPVGGRLASGAPLLYGLATGLFILALLSKSVTATLPAALLLGFWWQRGRLSWKHEVAPLAPWFILALGAGLLTAWVERAYIGAEGGRFDLGFWQRGILAGRVIWFYLTKLLWPAKLMFIYPHWTIRADDPIQWIPLGAALAITGLLIMAGWRCFGVHGRSGAIAFRAAIRAVFFGWAFFVLTLFPALGFFNVYPFIFSYVADHFQYLASFGIIALGAAGWMRWMRAPRLAAAVLLGILGMMTWRQARQYRDAATLYEVTLQENPDCWLAHLNLGNILLAQGRLDEAVAHYRRAEEIEPDYPSTHFNLAKVLLQRGQLPGAIAEFGQALRLNPGDAEARNNLGVALADSGRLDEAKDQFEQALRLRPSYPVAQANLARLEAGPAAPRSPR